MITLDLTPAQTADLIRIKLLMVVYDDPNARLLFAVWCQALVDAYRDYPVDVPGREELVARKRRNITKARDFVRSHPPCLELVGVNPEYAERIIRGYERHLPTHRRVFA